MHRLDFAFLISAVLAVPTAYIAIYFISGGKRHKKMLELERRGDVSDEFIQAFREYIEDPKIKLLHEAYVVTLALYYNMRGEYNNALQMLSEIPPSKYVLDPVHSNTYFAALLEAYSALGDFENADKVYADGYYYITTYMHCDDCAIFMRMPIAIYENHRGNHKLSIMLLEDGIKMGLKNTTPSQRLYDEMITTKAVFLIAQSYFYMGEYENALNALNQTEGKQCTQYCHECINKLYREINENVHIEQ